MEQLSKELRDTVKNLKMVYTDKIQPELLIAVPNSNKDVDYETENFCPEFTSQCPLNPTQPDYAVIHIRYCPKDFCVELKSLKFYLNSYREVPIFHESVPATIMKHLINVIDPKWMTVEGKFAVRGGITTNVRAVFQGSTKGR